MRLSILSVTLLTLGLSISPIYVSANPLTGTISQIIDGDNIYIRNNRSTTKLHKTYAAILPVVDGGQF